MTADILCRERMALIRASREQFATEHLGRCPVHQWHRVPQAWVLIATALWDIIDDIDSYDDEAKADDALFRRLVMQRQQDRFKVGDTSRNTGEITWQLP